MSDELQRKQKAERRFKFYRAMIEIYSFSFEKVQEELWQASLAIAEELEKHYLDAKKNGDNE